MPRSRPRARVPEVIGVRQAAIILDKDKMTVLRWLSAGRLTAIGRLPGRNGAYLLDRAEVLALADELRRAAS